MVFVYTFWHILQQLEKASLALQAVQLDLCKAVGLEVSLGTTLEV